MDENWFFRWVWRLNALGIAILLGSVAYGFVTFFLHGRGMLLDRSGTRVEVKNSDMRLTMIDALAGSDIVIFSYGTVSYGGGSSFKPPSSETVNYLFHNTKNGTSRWLLPGHDQRITSFDYVLTDGSAINSGAYASLRVVPQADGSPARSIRAFLFDVSSGSDFQAYASRSDGTDVTKLIEGADEAATVTPLAPDLIAILNSRNGRSYLTTFSLADFKKIRETDLTDQLPK
jgi:hypothetical protein